MNKDFNSEMEILRKKESLLCNKIIEELKMKEPNIEALYIPNFIPKSKVEYIFIAMEPSFRWAETEEKGKRLLKEGLGNFLWSVEDFIFHFSINSFLSKNYYITDISKIAMKTKNVMAHREKLYDEQKDLLLEELKLVATDNPKIFYVGNKPKEYLNEYLRDAIGPLIFSKKIIHYSTNANQYRRKCIESDIEGYKSFCTENILKDESLLNFIEIILEKYLENPEIRKMIYDRIRKKREIFTESRKQLTFCYFKAFSNLN